MTNGGSPLRRYVHVIIGYNSYDVLKITIPMLCRLFLVNKHK